MKEFIIDKEEIKKLNNKKELNDFLLTSIKEKIKNNSIKLKDLNIDSTYIKENLHFLKIYQYENAYTSDYKNKILNISLIIRHSIGFFDIIKIFFIVIDDIIFFYSNNFYNDDFYINFNKREKLNNEVYFQIIINNIIQYTVVNSNEFLHIGNFNSSNINDSKFFYKDKNYLKLFISMFPIAYLYENIIKYNHLFIDFTMPVEYTKKINDINKYFNFINKTEPFKNTNSGNHLVYFYETYKNYLEWK